MPTSPPASRRRAIYGDDHEDFRDSFRRFLTREVVPHFEAWERDGIVPREIYAAAGANGYLGMQVPEEYVKNLRRLNGNRQNVQLSAD